MDGVNQNPKSLHKLEVFLIADDSSLTEKLLPLQNIEPEEDAGPAGVGTGGDEQGAGIGGIRVLQEDECRGRTWCGDGGLRGREGGGCAERRERGVERERGVGVHKG